MQTAKLFFLLLVASLAVLVAVVEAGTTVPQGPFVRPRSYGDHFGAFTLCGGPALFGGNRPLETFLNSMVRVPVYDDSLGIIVSNSLPRNRNVSGNVALLINLRAFTLMQVTDKVASNQAWAFTATNCTYAPLVKDARWTFYMAYNGSSVFPADATEFAGAVVNKRYAVWAGGELASGSVISNAFVIDSNTDTISGASLSVARSGVAGVTATDGTAWFAGGVDRPKMQVFDTVDVINKDLNVESAQFQLSEPRGFAAGASAKGIVMIGGGVANYSDTGNGTIVATYSRTVDLFNLSTKKRTTLQLSVPRGMLTATATTDYIVFAGGITHSVYNSTTWELIEETYAQRIDVYHIESGTWSVAQLSQPRAYLASTAVGNAVVFSPGSYHEALGGNSTGVNTTVAYTNTIDVFRFTYTSPASSLRASPIFAYLASLFA